MPTARRAGGAPCAGHPGGGTADRSRNRPTCGWRDEQPPRQSAAFFPRALPSAKRAQLGMAHGELSTGLHSGQEDLAEALAASRSVEGHHGLPKAVDRPTIVTLSVVGEAEVVVCQRLQDDVPASCSECEGRCRGDGLVISAP